MPIRMRENYLKFWGTRGSCPVSGPEYAAFGGNTCCLEVAYENTLLIIDAGTGIRPLGEKILKERQKIDLLLGHTHLDHIIGFPFFAPLFQAGTEITIWAPASGLRSCKEVLQDLLSKEFFPVRLEEIHSKLDFRTLHPKTPVQFGPLTLDFHATSHPGGALGFKIKTPKKTIGYITDNEALLGYHGSINDLTDNYLEPFTSLIHFLSECDILIHEAQYLPEEYLEKEHWGHSSVQNVAAIVKMNKTQEWHITHHDPKHCDQKLLNLEKYTKELIKNEKIPCKVRWIKDGDLLYL